MFFIWIWRGPGLLVVPVVVLGLALAFGIALGLSYTGLAAQWQMAIALGLASPATAAAIWYMAKALKSKPRRLIDAETGREVLWSKDAGSLFFIPTRYWAFIVLVPGWLLTAMLLFAPLDSDEGESGAPEAVAVSAEAQPGDAGTIEEPVDAKAEPAAKP